MADTLEWSSDAHYYVGTVLNNYVLDTSACANHKRSSIAYREYRKGVKHLFKEELHPWESRWKNNRKPNSYYIKHRYCSAKISFNPIKSAHLNKETQLIIKLPKFQHIL